MPAGGTWKVQNKQRPGAYINFVSVPKPVGTIGDRGVMTCALPMTWGPTDKLITLYGDDLLNGKSVAKIGCDASDIAESLPYRLALAGCYKALLFRTNTGGQAATIKISEALTVNAKYAGTTGNDITIVITGNQDNLGEPRTVNVMVRGIRRETFVASSIDDFSNFESEWVEFVTGSGAIPLTSGGTLQGGTNGTVSNDLTTYFNLVGGENWQCLAVNSTESSVQQSIESFIKLMRETRGRKCQGVVYNTSSDYEGVIRVMQGYKTATDTVTVDLFPLYVASITAGANVNESNTARVIDGAISIIEPVKDEEIEEMLNMGGFILTYRQDGAVCVEKDINSLHTFTSDKGYAFSKNRVIRCLDEIGNTTSIVFNRNYCGKVDNDDIGRNLYKTELISMMDQLVDIGAVKNFEGASDITILPGADVDSVVVDMVVQPVDSMEKLYMTVNVDA